MPIVLNNITAPWRIDSSDTWNVNASLNFIDEVKTLMGNLGLRTGLTNAVNDLGFTPPPIAVNLALGRTYTYSVAPNSGTPARDDPSFNKLTDGLEPSSPTSIPYDTGSVGWLNTGPVTVTMDLGQTRAMRLIESVLPNGTSSGVGSVSMAVETSTDNIAWTPRGSVNSPSQSSVWSPTVELDFGSEVNARYIRFIFTRVTLNWIFISEIRVWSALRFIYYPLAAPLSVDDTFTAANQSSSLIIDLPGSAVEFYLNVTVDSVSNNSTRMIFFNSFDTTTVENTTIIAGGFNNVPQNGDVQTFMSSRRTVGLGPVRYVFANFNTGGRIKFVVNGIFIRHTDRGFTAYAEGVAERKKFLDFRLTQGSGNTMILKAVSGIAGRNRVGAIEINYNRHTFPQTFDNTSTFITIFSDGALSVHTNTLNKAETALGRCMGSASGFVLQFAQTAGLLTPFTAFDYLNSPALTDDGSVFARWGTWIPNADVGCVFSEGNPASQQSWLGGNRGFLTAQNFSPSLTAGECPTPYDEVMFGDAGLSQTLIYQAFAARSDDFLINRGEVSNLFFARNASFTAGPEFIWESSTGQRYFCFSRVGMNSGIAQYLFFIRL